MRTHYVKLIPDCSMFLINRLLVMQKCNNPSQTYVCRLFCNASHCTCNVNYACAQYWCCWKHCLHLLFLFFIFRFYNILIPVDLYMFYLTFREPKHVVPSERGKKNVYFDWQKLFFFVIHSRHYNICSLHINLSIFR